MKDIRTEALDLGLNEAGKLLAKQVEKGKIKPEEMSATLARIRPTLNYGDFKEVDIIIEAVVENPKVKKAVFAEVEGLVRDDTIIASNTSTISISYLAEGLKRPQNFVGMHFFNPVHMMPLVEVIRGKQSSDEAVAATVKLSQKMGKTPVVVNDCPGFFVNRVLFPYFAGFHMLLRDGADFIGGRQGDGEVRLADGPGVPDGRRRHGHRRARRGRDGRGLPGPHEARLHRTRRRCSSTTSATGRRPARVTTPTRPTRRASRRRRRSRDLRADQGRGRGAQGVRARGDRRALHGADGQRGRALPRGEDRRLAVRGRHVADLRHRLPAVPRRRVPLRRPDRVPRTSSHSPTSTPPSASSTRRRSCCATWRRPARSSSADPCGHHEFGRGQT